MGEENLKVEMFPGGKTIVINHIDPQYPTGGTSTLMRNLLINFDKSSFEVICCKPNQKELKKQRKSESLFFTNYLLTDVWSMNSLYRKILYRIFMRYDTYRIQMLIDKIKPKCVFITYPNIYDIEVFQRLQLPSSTKVVGYFNDTFVEGQLHKYSLNKLEKLHKSILGKLNLLFVMNEGMQRLYNQKYHYATISLEHCFPEYNLLKNDCDNIITTFEKIIFWGGRIVGYNASSIKRISKVGTSLGFTFELATNQSEETIEKYAGLEKTDYVRSFYEREEYLLALKSKAFLLLALDWPDESIYHVDEISTIFSTKAIEYFTSHRPVIIHCPEDYFMAKFIKQRNCGYVISSRNLKEIRTQMSIILNSDHSEVILNAKIASALFSPKAIIDKYLKGIETIKINLH